MKKFKTLFSGIAFVLAGVLASCSLAPTAQAGALSDYLENKLTDHVFRAQAYTAPVTIYVELYTSACSDAARGTEVTGGSYARVGVTSGLTAWVGTHGTVTGASSGTGGTTSNAGAVNFPTPTAGWGLVTHVGLSDASTAGNLLVCTALSVSKTINTGDTVSFPAASLTNQIDN